MIHDLARSYTSLGRAIRRFPTAPWDDALAHGQLQSKAWAIQHLKQLNRDLGLVYVLGGWLGTMALLMFASSLRFGKIRSFDLDPSCAPIADQVNIEQVIAGWRFKAATLDMHGINYGRDHRYDIRLPDRIAHLSETCDTVINTCCDHLGAFDQWWRLIPAGKFVVLQNNDFHHGDSDHVNTVGSLDALRAQAPMTTILVQDQLKFEKYTRFMVIGYK